MIMKITVRMNFFFWPNSKFKDTDALYSTKEEKEEEIKMIKCDVYVHFCVTNAKKNLSHILLVLRFLGSASGDLKSAVADWSSHPLT